MSTRHPFGSTACIIALLWTASAAAAAVPVRGAFDAAGPVHVAGSLDVAAVHGALDLAPAADAGEDLRLDAPSAQGYRVTRTYPYTGPGPDTVEVSASEHQPENETLAYGPGTLRNFTCAQLCRILLYTDAADAGHVRYAGDADGNLEWLDAPARFHSGAITPGHADTFYYEAPAGWAHVTGARTPDEDATRLRQGAPAAAGALRLFLANASVELHTAEGVVTLDARAQERPTHGPGDLQTGREVDVIFLVLHFEDANFMGPAGSRARLFAPEPQLALDGSLSATDARGRILVDGTRHDLQDQDVRVVGELDARARSRAGPLPAPTQQPLLDEPVATGLQGEAREVAIDGVSVMPLASNAAATVVGLTTLTLVVSALALAKWLGVGPFYTRIERSSVLRNPNRNHIYQAVRDHPGDAVADLTRRTGIAEVVLRHHLRMLERHQFVVMRPVGKLRLFYPTGADAADRRAHLHASLRDTTRRRIADALADAPRPLTQRDLATAADVSQRLVSYHLARLESAGLVHRDHGALPRRYRATDRLATFLTLDEQK